jgi:uncharacterized protein
MRPSLTILLAISIVSATAVAGNAEKDKDTKTATMALMRQIMPPEAYDAVLDQMYQQMSASMKQAGGGAMTPKQQKGMKAAVKEALPYEDLLTWTGEIYAKHFTKKEIDDIAAFYATPTGKKVARMLPALSGEMGAKMGPLLMTRLPAALKKHGVE